MANKLKTHKGAAKRFKITKNKKVLTCKSGNNHLLTNKGKTHKKSPYGKALSSSNSAKVISLVPYK